MPWKRLISVWLAWKKAMIEEAAIHSKAELIRTLQSLRGIGFFTSITLAAELGSFARFRSPAQLMAYLGLIPCEHSSGASTKRGTLTKAGNGRLRRSLFESAWSYHHRPAIKGDLVQRLEGLPAEVQQISWKAQERLHREYRRLVFELNKHKNVAISAVARELRGFIWAVARTLELPSTS
ncbi:transposase [Paenibacillus xylanexedens]|uniref:transposase n=1 Tax=Paenibacillus xylanexedens TaxID=528191 RepID=UPI001C930DDF|nr:transposase [Paenibacillus xylanexedens]